MLLKPLLHLFSSPKDPLVFSLIPRWLARIVTPWRPVIIITLHVYSFRSAFTYISSFSCTIGLEKGRIRTWLQAWAASPAPLPPSHTVASHSAPQPHLPPKVYKVPNSSQSLDAVPGSSGMEGRDEANTSAKRKIGHLKITRRALGSCAMLQLSGFPLLEDVRKLGNESLAVLGTHSKKET